MYKDLQFLKGEQDGAMYIYKLAACLVCVVLQDFVL